MGAEVVHHDDLPRRQCGSQDPLRVEVSKKAFVVEPSTTIDGPIPSTLMLESKVRLAPQLRGASKHTLFPLRDQP